MLHSGFHKDNGKGIREIEKNIVRYLADLDTPDRPKPEYCSGKILSVLLQVAPKTVEGG